jgi:hypothetical protein
VSATPDHGPADEGRSRETKQCPDCAETVLAAARKCRFCGYRFDRSSSRGTSLLERLGIFRPRRQLEFVELLAEWGIELAGGETAACFRLVVFDDQKGYLLVTDERLVFVADRRRSQTAALEYRRTQVRGVSAARGGHQLTILAGGREHRIAVGPASSPDLVRAALEALAAAV